MTEKSIQEALFFKLGPGARLVVPNYSPRQWWECDFWRLMKSGMTEEYEIKLTLSDFNADARKCRYEHRDRATHFKHLHLSTGSPRATNRFYYVVTESLADKIALPAFSGLYVAREWGGRVWVDRRRNAPLLHKEKRDADEVALELSTTFYHRYWNLRVRS